MSIAAALRRFFPGLGVFAALVFLGACDQRGFSGRAAELARQQSGGFYVVESSHKGAVVVARGKQVAVKPAPGFCLAEDSIETSRRSIFILIGDCAVEAPTTGARGARGELQLPKAIPGILTVSISGDPGFRSRGSSFEELTQFLESPEGRAMLGRSGSGEGVVIKESREMDGALLLHLEDRSTDLVPILSNRFWRAFVELNGRLTVVTISGFRDRPLGRERMLAYLISQVQTLGGVNETPLGPPDTRLASAETIGDASRKVEGDGTRKLSAVRAEANSGVTIVDATSEDNAEAALKAAEAEAKAKTEAEAARETAESDAVRETAEADADAEAARLAAAEAKAAAARAVATATAASLAPIAPNASSDGAPDTKVAATVPDVDTPDRTGASRFERNIVLPPPRPGAARAPEATRPARLEAPSLGETTSGVPEPVRRRDTAAAVKGPDPASKPVTADGVDVSGPATKNAPKSAPIAPKRRR